MLFTDFYFIFLFLPVILLTVWNLKSRQYRLLILLLGSYIFYAAWNYKFVSLLLFSTCVDFFFGLMISRNKQNQRIKKIFLILSVSCNLTILGFFKYFNFFMGDAQAILAWFGLELEFPLLNVVLPIGISFYTFQSMSYTIDVYRGCVKATRNFLKFASYVSLFPQLVAGPIVRYKDIAGQLERMDRPFSLDNLTVGLQIFLLGLFKKVLIADSIAKMITPMFDNYLDLEQFGAWMAALGYAFQIYFDFSGYSDMAIGLGKMFGLQLPYNFNSPYKASNIADFWLRWHITLSTWLRDYLYIPLGGNRVSKRRTAFNVLFVFALGGLWHGAAWTFVIWGIYQGALVAGYYAFRRTWDNMPVILQRTLTFFFVVIGWIFFRSDDVPMALNLLEKMFHLPTNISLSSELIRLVVWNGTLLCVVNLLSNTNSFKGNRNPYVTIIFAFLFVLSIIAINSLRIEFLYYQF